MYRDFEDLRENCPAQIKANIAIDFLHDDPERLAALWKATGDDEFRLYLVTAVNNFWDEAVRTKGGKKVPDDGFAIEIELDSYHDPEMGYSLYLDLHAYCGTEAIGDLCWSVFDDAALELTFMKTIADKTRALLAEKTEIEGLHCQVEITEVEET
jgi:hypothetical protein